ncbi:putative l-psp endoribonuclease family protein [Botrytis fragariae]|uniref:Putative l-psp endoribonuclease family protein n=1 Tax=Botrytis fragariae TaxID=1964551 RepID=A0A8H6AKN2_9HELO|nr:putative l-psp endoribonuclease family protein [Botrytis fragariae]KAF5869134.1 putative l-psp endoribonuclease family protein [Botrytis fragariae]
MSELQYYAYPTEGAEKLKQHGYSQAVRVGDRIECEARIPTAAMTRNFKMWMPHHAPIWTCVGVARLGDEEMRVEIEIVALDAEGAEAAREAGER